MIQSIIDLLKCKGTLGTERTQGTLGTRRTNV
jgi:hypothetical protein